ncbi:MAG: hypothetical protein CMQ15_16540 [Gammaproteobacteria bacterium]|jgi:hypothetical protein|nr:hypothetical protein [Gammaproteobacteria bacterium]|tara:strand:- start:2091 stop:2678 length:588 start_codon:yes stop_codon:yes gene_type:complete
MKMINRSLVALLIIPFKLCPTAYAQDNSDHKRYTTEGIMEIAMSAAPANVSGNATIMASDGSVLREGSNGWVCMPGTPPNENVNPMCVDPAWQNWLQEYMKAIAGASYEYDSELAAFGVSYMLVGDIPVDNDEPFNQDQSKGVWVAEGPHLMLLLPASMMKGLPRDPFAGGPYVMWEGSDFVHVMVPLRVTEPLK